MALNTALVISGDGDGAERALRGVSEELDRGTAGAEAYNRAYANTDASIRKLANAQAEAKRESMQTAAAYKAGEISLEQYNRELLQTKTALGLVEAEHQQTVKALRQANSALGQAPGQTGAARAGYAQLGAQMQDVAVMAQGGANIGTIIATQGGQVASAVQMMGGRFSGLAGFLAGPWGAAVMVGASVVGNLVASLWEAEDAAEQAEFATYAFSDAQSILGNQIDLVTGKLRQQTGATMALAQAQIALGRVEAIKQRSEAQSTMVGIRKGGIGLRGGMGGGLRFERSGDGTEQIVSRFQSGQNTGAQAIAQLENRFDSGDITEEAFARAASAIANYDVANANIGVFDDAQAALRGDQGALQRFLTPNRSGGGRPGGAGGGRADRSARELEQMERHAEKLEDRIAGISDRFMEQPSLLGRVNEAIGDLDAMIADLSDETERQPENVAQLIAQAQLAKGVVQDALLRPFTELREESERRQQIDLLLLAGNRDQAAVLQEIWRIEEQLGPLNAQQRAEVEAIVLAEQEHLELLEEAQDRQLAYLDTTRGVRAELEAMLSGRGDLSNFQQLFRDLKARVMVEQIFGPAFQELEDYVTQNTALPDAVDTMARETARAGGAATTLADVLVREAERIANPVAAGPSASFSSAFAEFGRSAANDNGPDAGNVIVVTANPNRTANDLSPEKYFERMADAIAGPILEGLDDTFGVEFFSEMRGALAGALQGYARGGTVGGVLGGVQGLLDSGLGDQLFGGALNKSISGLFSKGLEGAQTGQMVSGLADMLGIGMSKTGSSIGGAVGGFLPIPGGAIIGSVAGGLLGGLFKKTPYGTARVTGADGYSTRGKQGDIAGGLAGSLQGGLGNIAEALGAEIGRFNVSLGTFKDSFRVSTTGRSGKLSDYHKRSDVFRFDNEADAVAFAIADAISDGAITGISAAMQKALRSSPDVEKAVEEALRVQDLEELLAEAGDAWREELSAFEELARERVDMARQYGLDLVKVEELNAKQRLELTEELLEAQVGSLQALIDDMTSGNLFEGSAVERREQLLGKIGEARIAAAAGEEGAADRLAGLLRQLNEVSSEVFGSTGGFAADRSTILDTARDVIADANRRLEDAKQTSDPALQQTNAALDENNDQNAQLIDRIEELTGVVRIAFGGSVGGSAGRSLNVGVLAQTR